MSQPATYWIVAACDADHDFTYDGSSEDFLFAVPDGPEWDMSDPSHNYWKAPVDIEGPLLLTAWERSGAPALGAPDGWYLYADPHPVFITDRNIPGAAPFKMRMENLPKDHTKRERRRRSEPSSPHRVPDVIYAAYTKDGKKVREPSDYRPRPPAQIPRHPDYWTAYWTQWEKRMGQLRRGVFSDPRDGAVKVRNYIEHRLDELRYRNGDIESGREQAFWGAVFHRYWQQYNYACLARKDEVRDPEEVKRRYFEQTLPTDEGWKQVILRTLEYVECYPVVHVLSAYHAGGVEAKLSAIECAGRRLKMYGDLKKAARALLTTKPEIVAERLPAATRWAVENFDGDILSFMRKVVSKIDPQTRRAGRKAAEDFVNTECPVRATSLDAMKDSYDYEPEIGAGVYDGDPENEPSITRDEAAILAESEHCAKLRGIVREHLKGDQQQWALLKLSGVDSTKKLCKELDTTPDKLKRTAYAARAKLKKSKEAKRLYEGAPEFSDVLPWFMGGGVRNPRKVGRGKAPRDLRPGAKRTQGWPVVGYASPERRARIGETVRLHRVRRRLSPAPLPALKDQRLVEHQIFWGSPTEDYETLGKYPTTWPLLKGRDKRAAYDPNRGRQSAALFLKLM